uniref:Ig-like domain-containing protein n=1 Tax=Denticeps clupeoides TaxID=299321 RepID=A0AAY4A8M4_9TELE
MHILLECTMFLFTESFQLYQRPRFVRVKTGRDVTICCWSYPMENKLDQADWELPQKIALYNNTTVIKHKRCITLLKVNVDNSGEYFCKYKNYTGPGTVLMMFVHHNPEVVLMRSNIKDAMILIQALLFGLFLLLPRFCYRNNVSGVGLEIEQCLYEDIPAYSQQGPDDSCDMESPDQE